MDMPKDTPERLIDVISQFLGNSETVRVLRLSDRSGGQALSKMKNPPDLRNMENGGHVISFLERVQFIGEKLTVEITRAEQEKNDKRADEAKMILYRIARFCAYVLNCVMIPNNEWKEIQDKFDRYGLIIIALSTLFASMFN